MQILKKIASHTFTVDQSLQEMRDIAPTDATGLSSSETSDT